MIRRESTYLYIILYATISRYSLDPNSVFGAIAVSRIPSRRETVEMIVR